MNLLRNKLAITLAVSLLILLCLGWVFWSMYRGAENLRNELNSLEDRTTLSGKEREGARLTHLLEEENSAAVERIKSFFVDRVNPVKLVEELENTAKLSKNDFSVNLDENLSKGEDMFFRLTVAGTEKSVKNYLRLLELIPYHLRIEEFIFQKVEAETNAPSRSGLFNPVRATHRLILLISVKAQQQ